MRAYNLIIVSFAMIAVFSAQLVGQDDSETDQAMIAKVLQTQSSFWNNGDIPGFMEYYWKSEELTFSFGGSTFKGWQAMLDRYQEAYPTQEKMGQLTFSGLNIQMLDKNVALVLGDWNLDKQADDAVGGNFSLVLKQFDNRWLIIHDHTSVRKSK